MGQFTRPGTYQIWGDLGLRRPQGPVSRRLFATAPLRGGLRDAAVLFLRGGLLLLWEHRNVGPAAGRDGRRGPKTSTFLHVVPGCLSGFSMGCSMNILP